jgi:hypothetical protein
MRCATVYKYHSSPWESRWLKDVADLAENSKTWSRGCERLQEERALARRWEAWGRARLSSSGVTATFPMDVFSFHNFSNSCNPARSLLVPIEPLVGFLRHPRFQLAYCTSSSSWDHITSKNHLVTTWSHEASAMHSRAGLRRRALLFDLGSGPGPGGGGQEWFVDTYGRRGVAFDRVLAWEGKVYDPRAVLDRATKPAYDALSFYNVPIETDPDSLHNPLRVLRSVARVDDFVVFKLDVDNSSVEEAIVNQLLSKPALLALVDELFWEHHVTRSPMQHKGWGQHVGRHTNQTLASSYSLFLRLRALGIRAHSWV